MDKMYSMSEGDAAMPLRQTCDRCRYLKVRCEKDSRSPSVRCVRCSKAGAICVHNPRRRSGRPTSTNSVLHNSPRDADEGSSQDLRSNMDFCNDTSPQNWSHKWTYPDMTLRSSLDPHFFSLFSTRSLSSSQGLDQFMESGEGGHTPPFDYHAALDQGLDMFADLTAATTVPARNKGPDNISNTMDAMETDMQVLTELNVRAYRLMTSDRTPFTEELCAITDSVLKVLTRVTAMAREQQSKAGTPGCGEKDNRLHIHQTPRVSISLVLQGVSVCEQIYSAFIHVCSLLRNGLELHSDTNNENDAGDHRMSDAQAVMTVELINYLFEKLNRAQKQLLDTALTVEDASPSSVESLGVHDSATSPKLSLQSDSSPNYSPTTGIITVMMNRTCGKHPQLQNAIKTIRDLARDKDGI
ncbi:hypothetical protein NW756_006855 [Fusarium oxysporum]|nr:hypothetical protein NW756_006855 [Fusarium oxysporum]